MKTLHVIVDLSGSMSALGKSAIAGTLLATLAALPPDCGGDADVQRHRWDGRADTLVPLLQTTAGEATLLVTDGYALADSAGSAAGRAVREALGAHTDSLFVVRCGPDAVDLAALKEFRGVPSVAAEDVLYAVETLRERSSVGGSADNASGEDWA